MNEEQHRISIDIERTENHFFLSLKMLGTLTHEDYEEITPKLESALAEVREPKIDALVDLTELEGWTLRAAWDDFKLGVIHGTEFEKIAILGHEDWQETFSKVGSWFVRGEVKYFEDRKAALAWLQS
jgi:hypothetical protein